MGADKVPWRSIQYKGEKTFPIEKLYNFPVLSSSSNCTGFAPCSVAKPDPARADLWFGRRQTFDMPPASIGSLWFRKIIFTTFSEFFLTNIYSLARTTFVIICQVERKASWALSQAERFPARRWVKLSVESSWALSRTALSQAERWVKLSAVPHGAESSQALSRTYIRGDIS